MFSGNWSCLPKQEFSLGFLSVSSFHTSLFVFLAGYFDNRRVPFIAIWKRGGNMFDALRRFLFIHHGVFDGLWPYTSMVAGNSDLGWNNDTGKVQKRSKKLMHSV